MKETFQNVKWFFKEEWKKYCFCFFLLLIVSITPIMPAKFLGLVIDAISMGTLTNENLVFYCCGLIFFPLLTYIVNIFYHYNMNKLGQNLSFKLREKYITHLFEMDAELYEKYTKGDLISRATNDLNNITVFATSFMQNIVYYAALISAAIIIMITINPLLTLCSVIFMPFAIFYLNKRRLKRRQYYKIHQEIYANMTENVLESIEGVKTVRAYGQEEADFQKTKDSIDADIDSWWRILKFEAMYTPMFELVYAVCYFIAIGYGSYMVIHSTITPGELVSFLVYVAMLYTPLIGLSNLLNSLNTIAISNARYCEILNREALVKDEENPVSVLKFNTIKFNDVSFKYPFDQLEVIKNITFEINSGQTIGIVGPTGAGKSTLIKQLLREFNVTQGTITIDNIDLVHYKIEDVRNLVGYVPQNHILFRRSVDNNILIGNPEADSITIDEAINVADFKKDLKALPLGLSTMVAELGGSLSGGQRQRLSIARALVKNPEILILDDSLSAVDALTESNIIKKLKDTRKNKTNIIVAHRFSAVADADKIIVMQNGMITDFGTHSELLKYDNWYKSQYLKQIKGDIYEEL